VEAVRIVTTTLLAESAMGVAKSWFHSTTGSRAPIVAGPAKIVTTTNRVLSVMVAPRPHLPYLLRPFGWDYLHAFKLEDFRHWNHNLAFHLGKAMDKRLTQQCDRSVGWQFQRGANRLDVDAMRREARRECQIGRATARRPRCDSIQNQTIPDRFGVNREVDVC
jgi:hypothetical protein